MRGQALALALVALFFMKDGCGAALPPAILRLERANRLHIEALRAHDIRRRSRLQRNDTIITFPVEGSANPMSYGIYFTKVNLGSPPREFRVEIDTGSNIFWVSCTTCTTCSPDNGLGMRRNFFDVNSSSTVHQISCGSPTCNSNEDTVYCSAEDDNCGFSITYMDTTNTTGILLTDRLHLDVLVGHKLSAPVVFGCSEYESNSFRLDGLIGLGPGEFSVTSQLSEQGVSPYAFSHCLEGGPEGGGVFILGKMTEPGTVYTPLIPSMPDYRVHLESIAMNGQTLLIGPKSSSREIAIDSGTTFAYLRGDAFDFLNNSITAAAASYSLTSTVYGWQQCYNITTSVSDIFPIMTLKFTGGATMALRPEDYFVYRGQNGSFCLGFLRADDDVAILGELALKNKIVVYDLAEAQIGWIPHNCSLPVNMSIVSAPRHPHRGAGSSLDALGVHFLLFLYIMFYLYHF